MKMYVEEKQEGLLSLIGDKVIIFTMWLFLCW